MSDLLDVLDKEKGSETKQIKIIQQSEDYSESYKNVVFEKYALRQNINHNNNKCLCNFQDSLDNLIQRGYLRHPRPNEVFSLLCAYLEGEPSIKCVAEDMLHGSGEWFSLAMKLQNNILYCYIDPSFEIVNKRGMQYYNLKSHSSEKLFSFSSFDKQLLSIKEINVLNPSLVEFLWSRSFAKLPLEIRNNAHIYLSDDEHIGPAGRGNYGRYIVNYYYDYWASRGVHEITDKTNSY